MEKKLSYLDILAKKGAGISISSIIALFITTGVINIFQKSSDKLLFNAKIPSNAVIQTFFDGNTIKCLTDFCLTQQALQHGIIISPQKIESELYCYTEFLENNKFSNQKFREFLNKNQISQADIFNYFRLKLTSALMKKILVQIPVNIGIPISINNNMQLTNYGTEYILDDSKIEIRVPTNTELELYIKEYSKNSDTLFLASTNYVGKVFKFININNNLYKMIKHFIYSNINDTDKIEDFLNTTLDKSNKLIIESFSDNDINNIDKQKSGCLIKNNNNYELRLIKKVNVNKPVDLNTITDEHKKKIIKHWQQRYAQQEYIDFINTKIGKLRIQNNFNQLNELLKPYIMSKKPTSYTVNESMLLALSTDPTVFIKNNKVTLYVSNNIVINNNNYINMPVEIMRQSLINSILSYWIEDWLKQ